MPKLITSAEITDIEEFSEIEDDSIFRYCNLSGLVADGKPVDASFIGCNLTGFDWYWGLFAGCLFADTNFFNCTFRGVNFSGCRFLNCKFENCVFGEDKLGKGCGFDDSIWLLCRSKNTVGLPSSVQAE